MANNNSRRTSGSQNRSYGNSNRSSGRGYNRSGNGRGNSRKSSTSYDEPILNPDIVILLTIALGVLLFLCNLHLIGAFGEVASGVMFGLFGLAAYIVPIGLILVVFFSYASAKNPKIKLRFITSIFIFILLCILVEEIGGVVRNLPEYDVQAIWKNGVEQRAGGGIICGSLAYLMHRYLGLAGTILVCLVLILICVMIIMGRERINGLKDNGREAYRAAREDAYNRRMYAKEQALARQEEYPEDIEEQEKKLPRYARKHRGIGTGIGRENTIENPEIKGEALEQREKRPRVEKRVSGVMTDTSLRTNKPKSEARDDMHEIMIKDMADESEIVTEKAYAKSRELYEMAEDITFNGLSIANSLDMQEINTESVTPAEPAKAVFAHEEEAPKKERVKATPDKSTQGMDEISKNITRTMNKAVNNTHKKYKMPTPDLLNKAMAGGSGNSREELTKIAKNLQDTLETFGVKARVTDISQGPSVTRFELQPELGVRVNKIVSLTDDLKLALAAVDIRIEAPIPGKSAVGIEIPNKESFSVSFRDLIEDKTFKNFDSKIAFAVGKDIAGKVVVTDIGKMPHMLIAGSTGSGKSVCINTIIMSILYKAHPDDVKLIMVDPKVVELSVYNGIPHLMVPVVTDPKKAAAALHWGVAEMTKRYQLFAEMNVRDLKGYNKAVAALPESDDENAPKKLPQIVIIVDELADLMMVAAKEVEESICRLAQLARACGIHLIIATQRPSVDVITGLIKANMPSRVAFAVSSGVDSRTILDMNGAEKLLGKGDMLFYPQGYPKPARVQGAFISDEEVGNVVRFLKEQDYGNEGQEELLIKMNSISSQSGSGFDESESEERDELFAQAGAFIIAQEKASIGSLQRKFKIGFNRAARIMDQLCEAGVVGDEEGTKARQVLMSPEAFEEFVDSYV